MNRSKRKAIAQETIEIMDTGTYVCLNSGRDVDIKTQIEAAIQSRKLPTEFEVANETTNRPFARQFG